MINRFSEITPPLVFTGYIKTNGVRFWFKVYSSSSSNSNSSCSSTSSRYNVEPCTWNQRGPEDRTTTSFPLLHFNHSDLMETCDSRSRFFPPHWHFQLFHNQSQHFEPSVTIPTLCVYLRTSSGAIYSCTVPPGDSYEYFDQIWFPPEPPGVAVSPPPLAAQTLPTAGAKCRLDEAVHDPHH